MPPTIRPASAEDAPVLAEILNRIIALGGTTAHQTPFTTERMLRSYVEPERNISCSVAELGGAAVGFQSLMWPDEEGTPFPDGWAIIASFVDSACAGQGVGRRLFDATRDAARAAGVRVIDATIRADNAGGLAYYRALGFEDYDVLPAVPLRNGARVDRVRKKFTI